MDRAVASRVTGPWFNSARGTRHNKGDHSLLDVTNLSAYARRPPAVSWFCRSPCGLAIFAVARGRRQRQWYTTLLRTLCGLSRPATGEIRWNNADIREFGDDHHQQLAYVGHLNGIQGELATACENSLARRLPRGRDRPRGHRCGVGAGWPGHVPRLPGQDSVAGPKTPLGAGAPRGGAQPLWILDEPFSALDDAFAERDDGVVVRSPGHGRHVLLPRTRTSPSNSRPSCRSNSIHERLQSRPHRSV